jgi:hypothetical protein
VRVLHGHAWTLRTVFGKLFSLFGDGHARTSHPFGLSYLVIACDLPGAPPSDMRIPSFRVFLLRESRHSDASRRIEFARCDHLATSGHPSPSRFVSCLPRESAGCSTGLHGAPQHETAPQTATSNSVRLHSRAEDVPVPSRTTKWDKLTLFFAVCAYLTKSTSGKFDVR